MTNFARGSCQVLRQDVLGARVVPNSGGELHGCALGYKACREGFSIAYRPLSRLLDEFAQARADGPYPNLLKRLAKTQVLILDDFGLEPLGPSERKELLKVLEDRYGTNSTVVTS